MKQTLSQYQFTILLYSYRVVLLLAILMSVHPVFSQDNSARYVVRQVKTPVEVDANWNKPVWQDIEPIALEYYMGDKPQHIPRVQAKLTYDEQNLYVIWKVDDQYVRAVAENHQGPVFRDSCVEFFFIPDNLGGLEYFNLEMNCGGTMLFHHQEYQNPKKINITEEDISQMKVAHSLPRLIPEEIKEKTTWYLEYAIPFKILKNYYQLETPQSGAMWRANFYKCADRTSHPHWLTWALVDNPKPNFHLPQFFGSLVFE